MRYVDFASGRPGAQNLLNDGYPGVVRYSSLYSWKCIDQAEFNDYVAHNIKTHIVHQDGIADHDTGFIGGKTKAQFAKTFISNLGWDGHTGCIYFAPFDSNETSATVLKTITYFQGINEVLPVQNIGVYGDADTLNAIRQAKLATYFWQSASKSFGPDVECHMRQLAQQTTINGVIVDINNVFAEDTGAITGGIANMPTELETFFANCTANGFNNFAEMFKIDTDQSKGIVALLRFLFNNSARSDQLGLVGVNVQSLHDEIESIKSMIGSIVTSIVPEIDYKKLAQAIIQEIKAL